MAEGKAKMDNYESYYQAPQQVYGPPNYDLKHSGFGIASFVIALLCGFGEFALVMVLGFLESSTPGGIDEESAVAVVLGLALFGGVVLAFVGLVLGLVGLVTANRKKVFAVLGLMFNAMLVMAVVGLVLLGLAME